MSVIAELKIHEAKLTELKEEMDTSAIMNEDFKHHLSRQLTSEQKILGMTRKI